MENPDKTISLEKASSCRGVSKQRITQQVADGGWAFVELPEVGICSLPVNPLQSLQLQPSKFLGFSLRISH